MKVVLFGMLLLVGGCASIKTPMPPPDRDVATVELSKGFPSVLPGGSSRFEQSQLFFVHADQASEFAVGLLVPIPFVTDIAVDYKKHGTASGYEKDLKQLSVYDLTQSALQRYPRLQEQAGGYRLYPMLFIEECYDDKYRLSLTYQLEKGDWFGRYYYHLPTTIPTDQIASPAQATMDQITLDLQSGANTLLSIIDRDIHGQFTPLTEKVTVGSLFIVGSKVSGITSPKFLFYKHAEILDQTADTYVLRVPGKPEAKAKSGGMAYGVHYFQKDQLHTFKPEVASE